MSDTKISALTALTGANVDAATDVLAIVDTSVTTTKKILVNELLGGQPTTTVFAGATTLLTIGGTGASSVFAIPGTLEWSGTTGAFTVAGGAYIGKKLKVVGAVDFGSTLGVTGAITPGQTTGIVGTTTNNSVQAGSVGEYISSTLAATSEITLTTATAANVTSISLTAGDWDVVGLIGFESGSGTNVVGIVGGINSTSATLPATAERGQLSFGSSGIAMQNGAVNSVAIPSIRHSLSGTTTIYLVAQASFTVAAEYAYGRISARRVR